MAQDQVGAPRTAGAAQDRLLLAGRALLALLFIAVGASKIFATAAYTAYFAAHGLPFPEAMPALVFAIEVGGGIALLLGVETRLLAFGFIAYTAAATLIAHRFWADPRGPAQTADFINFCKNLAIIGGFVLLAATGGGYYAADAWRQRRSRA